MCKRLKIVPKPGHVLFIGTHNRICARRRALSLAHAENRELCFPHINQSDQIWPESMNSRCAKRMAIKFDKGMLAFSWRLNERIFVCPVPKNDSVRWNCIPPRRGQRPRWYGPGGRAPGLSDQAVTGTLAGKGFPVCCHMAKRGADAFLEVASQPFAGGTISRCWHILFTR